MRSTLKILFEHIGESMIQFQQRAWNTWPTRILDVLKIIYNKHKSDGLNSDFNVKFYGVVIKKKNLWWKLLSWGNSPSSAQHQEKVIHLNWSWDPATTSWNRSTSVPPLFGGWKNTGFCSDPAEKRGRGSSDVGLHLSPCERDELFVQGVLVLSHPWAAWWTSVCTLTPRIETQK